MGTTTITQHEAKLLLICTEAFKNIVDANLGIKLNERAYGELKNLIEKLKIGGSDE